ncbi:MAG: citrate transporter [Blastocatellia bacterium]|nr:citrate transporter [Blastocatellia bacterium]
MMTAILILLIFVLFAALMMTRRMPAILAVPAMAVCIALAGRTPAREILDSVVANGAARLASQYLMVIAGAMLGRVVMQTGIAESLIKRAAEFGGDRPLVVAVTLMVAVAWLFTTLTGLGAIVMVGGLALPIMMSIGVPRKLTGVLFLLAYALGFIFNIGGWGFYQGTLNIDPQAVKRFAIVLAGIDAAAIAVFLAVASRRMKRYGAWAVAVEEEGAGKRAEVPLIALLAPILPLFLHAQFQVPVTPAFLIGAILGVLLTRPRELVRQLSSAAVKGIEDVAPAVILMIGIGMLLNATTLPAVKASLSPVIGWIDLRSPVAYVLFFGLLSPLALYRGPLNPYGIGIGVYLIVRDLNLLPPLALLAAVMSVAQVQNVCDPTNTHNAWVSNYVGMRVEELTRETLLYKIAVCLIGLIVGAVWYLN